MSDQEYVRGAWEECEHRDTALAVLAGPHYIVIGNRRRAGWRSFFAHSEAEAWAAAAEFTRERLEQVRQLEEEISLVSVETLLPVMRPQNMHWVRDVCRWSRILARLESALADLRKGMRA